MKTNGKKALNLFQVKFDFLNLKYLKQFYKDMKTDLKLY